MKYARQRKTNSKASNKNSNLNRLEILDARSYYIALCVPRTFNRKRIHTLFSIENEHGTWFRQRNWCVRSTKKDILTLDKVVAFRGLRNTEPRKIEYCTVCVSAAIATTIAVAVRIFREKCDKGEHEYSHSYSHTLRYVLLCATLFFPLTKYSSCCCWTIRRC